MKKIGIITFHNAHNYGAMLQVYALQNFIKKYNEDVIIINYENKRIVSNYKIFKPIRKNLVKYIKNLINDIISYKKNVQRYKKFETFMLNELNLTEKIKDIKYLNDNIYNFDICITGSDQVWNADIVGELSDFYTLNFGNEKLKRVSYAASIGDISIVERYKNDYKNKISKIDYISVRERDAQITLRKIINKDIEVVLDPTLLFTKEMWSNKLNGKKSEREKYILAYVVKANDEYLKIVNKLSKETGLKVIHFENSGQGYKNVLRSAYTEGPLEFVELIKNAEYVVATSFHATVFSILFRKKFFVIPHKRTGSRVIDLLDKLEITGRVFYKAREFNNIDYSFDTDWNIVEEKLEEQRNKSISFLKKAIEI